ncbi:MAG: hypothetical protein R3F37_20390 [Candidatus Competibacteraceae bacterium]
MNNMKHPISVSSAPSGWSRRFSIASYIGKTTSEFIELERMQQGNLDTPFKAHMLSDGTLRFICLATSCCIHQVGYRIPS